jgi:hypothetical protein
VDAPYYDVLPGHMHAVGGVLGNATVMAEMVATGLPFAVVRLTLAATSTSKAWTDPKRLQATAAALLPGLLPALVLVCTDQNWG